LDELTLFRDAFDNHHQRLKDGGIMQNNIL